MSTTPGVALGANDQDLPVGFDVGEYKVEAMIGKGGFGTVYRAVHPLIGKQVAIKVLARKYAADEGIVSRFVAEARAVNQIRHRNIIDIFLFSQLPDGRHYYVMEYLDGEALDEYLRINGPMPLTSAVPILRAIAKALDAAHAKGIAHRDLKPENIYLAHDPDGGSYPKLLDFGIAKLLAPEDDTRHRTATGVPIGTPYFMSPEQCRGRDVDHRTDVYSFGVVCYRVLTGAYPFEGDDYMELLFKQVNEEPPPPSSKNPALPPSVDHAIAWMMKKDREQRPPTVVEAVAALDPGGADAPNVLPRISGGSLPPVDRAGGTPDAFAKTTASTTAEPKATEPKPTEPRPRRTVWIGSALVLVCSVAGVALVLNHSPSDEVARDATTVAHVDPPPPTKPLDPVATRLDVGTSANSGNKLKDQTRGTGSGDLQQGQTAMVTVTFKNVPPGTTTLLRGVEYKLPGDVPVERGTKNVALVLRAKGFLPKSFSVIPDRDLILDGALVAERPKANANAKPTSSGDIIDLGHDSFRKPSK